MKNKLLTRVSAIACAFITCLTLAGCSLVTDMLNTAGEMTNDPSITNWSAVEDFTWAEEDAVYVDVMTPVDFGLAGYCAVTGVVHEETETGTSYYVTLDTNGVDDFTDDFDVKLTSGSASFTRNKTITAGSKHRVYFTCSSDAVVEDVTVHVEAGMLYPTVCVNATVTS